MKGGKGKERKKDRMMGGCGGFEWRHLKCGKAFLKNYLANFKQSVFNENVLNIERNKNAETILN